VDGGRGDVWQEIYQLASILLVVTTPERASLREAYAWMKQISARRTAAQIWLIANRVHDVVAARHAQQRLVLAADRFLNLDVSLAGLLASERQLSHREGSAPCGLLSSSTGSFNQTLERLVVRWMGDERKPWPAVATVNEKSEKTESPTGTEPITSPSLFAPTVVKM
jgi:MinD-like ATPase involved in chromosome partitioning or flagellar assembly